MYLVSSPDPLSNWCAAVALSHCLKGNQTQKEQLLRVQLATSVGERLFMTFFCAPGPVSQNSVVAPNVLLKLRILTYQAKQRKSEFTGLQSKSFSLNIL